MPDVTAGLAYKRLDPHLFAMSRSATRLSVRVLRPTHFAECSESESHSATSKVCVGAVAMHLEEAGS